MVYGGAGEESEIDRYDRVAERQMNDRERACQHYVSIDNNYRSISSLMAIRTDANKRQQSKAATAI